jgi:hypothetical protein
MPTPTTRLPRDQANPAFATSPFSLVVAARRCCSKVKIFASRFRPLYNNHLAHAEIWCECRQSTHRRPWMGRRCTKNRHLSDCAFLVQNLGANDIDDLRLRAGIHGRPKRQRSGGGATETWGGQGVSRSGERSQDRPAAASPACLRNRCRRRRDCDAA